MKSKVLNGVLIGATVVAVIAAIVFLFISSGEINGETAEKVASEKIEEPTKKGTIDSHILPETGTVAYQEFGVDRGLGVFHLIGKNGSTANGVVPSIDSDKVIVARIHYEARDFDPALSTYIYIDGVEAGQAQIGNKAFTLILTEENGGLVIGSHKIQLVQFPENKRDALAVSVKTQQYEVQ
ncbi:hypothetical protein [Enterococcus sp. LJL51]|uniref:hypothetical protein n=1 Tax=Enterococcus sp. LJL51 TaxID=3416656 RepID=UPI003CF31AA5